jgi:hypothetical protein
MPSFTITTNETKKTSSKKHHHKKSGKKSEPKEKDYGVQVTKEIAELETKKGQQGTGFRAFLRKAVINKQIHEKRKFLNTKDQLRGIKVATETTNAQVNLQKARAELKALREKNSVNFDNIGLPATKKITNITFDDLYK